MLGSATLKQRVVILEDRCVRSGIAAAVLANAPATQILDLHGGDLQALTIEELEHGSVHNTCSQ